MSSIISLATSNPSLRWAAGGWAFFIAENAILSENRTWLIEELGDDRYHLCYGTLSTIATGSIGYAFHLIRKQQNATLRLAPSPAAAVGAWAFLSMGLAMASQVAPKLQIPVGWSNQSFQVRCPFDFTDKKNPNDSSLHGLERISRHPGLWSFGFIGLGQSLLATSVPLRVWWMGPAAVAWLGGSHTDSRFRRGMGGTLEPGYASQTSNVPFMAMLTGKQGSGSWSALLNETKPLNAALAVGMSSLWVLRRVR
jgi:uncharacterized membrane protein